MNSVQYTIRSISPKLDLALRARAKKTGKSLNEVVLDTLARGAGISPTDTPLTDMDWFIGKKSLDAATDAALDWLDSAPKEIR